jgi:hypothetical protein
MADKKISALPAMAGTDVATGSLLHVIDTSGTYTNKNLTVGNMFQNVPTWLGLNSSQSTITASGAVDLVSSISPINSGSGVLALTLADGSQGQVKIVTMITAGNNAVLIPASRAGYATITFDAVGESVILLFTNSTWVIVGSYGTTIA